MKIDLTMVLAGFCMSSILQTTGHSIDTWQWWGALGVIIGSYVDGLIRGMQK